MKKIIISYLQELSAVLFVQVKLRRMAAEAAGSVIFA